MNRPKIADIEQPDMPGWSEKDRLAILHSYKILDTGAEDEFDDIVKLAAQAFNMPVSLISFVDEDRQWFKAKIGTDMSETGLDVSFCKHAILETDILVVPDAAKDSRFVNNALVTGDPKIRFYAGAPLKTPSGIPLGSICVLDTKPRELTEQDRQNLQTLARQVMTLLELKRALWEKQKSEERLQFALDTSAIVGTWDYDIETGLVYCDVRFAKLFSIDPQRGLRGVPVEEFNKNIHPADQEKITKATQEAIDLAGEFALEYRVIQQDGEMRWVFARGRAYHNDQGNPTRFPGAAVDITDRKRYERKQAARVELNDRLREIRHTSEITLVAAEIIGHALDGIRAGYGFLSDSGAIIEIERDWTNGEAASVAGIHHFSSFGDEFAKSVMRGETIVIDDVEKDPRCINQLESYKKIDVRSLVNISLVEDGIPQALFYIHDSKPRHWREGEVELITEMALRTWAEAERVRAERQMEEALQKAEAANIAKTEFLTNMSHEIRTPMNVIVGLSNILGNEKLTTRQSEFVKTLQMSADSLLSLINDLLDIAKIEARTVELEKIPFNLAQIVQEVISMMSVRAKEKGLDFTMEDGGAAEKIFLGDPTRLRQIVLNLCSNAIKFTEKGGIHISIVAHPTDKNGMEKICILVKDSGIGIAEDKIDTIFEKFIQADTSINRRYGGTGLGLAITKTLIGIMGGTINAESEVGKGSVFTVCIPLEVSSEKLGETWIASETSVAQLNENYRKRILLVEDYAPNVLVAGTFLEEFGFEWESAKSGLEAVEKFIEGKFTAILMDVQMFGMNGLEATRLIREHEQKNGLPHIPIIGMTAHALSGDRERCLSVGMDDYISKPFNPEELQSKLQILTGLS